MSHLGLYVHVPFCATTCDFCAFYQEAPKREELLRYLGGIERELARYPERLAVESVFFGGGTPGLLAARDLEALGRTVLGRLAAAPQEWTIELAPSAVKADKARLLRELGVTRVSLGVQSFEAGMLERLGRQHNPKQVRAAIDTLRAAGFENLNLDLIFAVPGQTLDEWERDLEQALAEKPAHISTYCLTFEEDTALWVKLQRGEVRKSSEAEEVQFYRRTWEILGEAGLAQYEVSNFAQQGYACKHNLNTWRMGEWIGVGPSAAGQYRGRRWTNIADLGQWLGGLEGGQPALRDEITLDDATLALDACIFGLRMVAGIDLTELRGRFPQGPWESLEALWVDLEAEGLLERAGTCVRLTDDGRLVADRVGLAVLEAGTVKALQPLGG